LYDILRTLKSYQRGFKEIRSKVLLALKEGNIQHELRAGKIEEKNLLLSGQMTNAEVEILLKSTRGTEFTESPHHLAPDITVYIFKPSIRSASNPLSGRWYVKCYFLEPDVWFISVHRSLNEREA
jgi:hypothetical protein